MNCEELEELAGALALGAALPDEVQAARAHLSGCPRAHNLLRELTATASLLAEAVEPAEPPARLRGRILTAVRAEKEAAATAAIAEKAEDAPDGLPVSLRPRPLREVASPVRPSPLVTPAAEEPRPLQVAPAAARRSRGPAPWTGWLAAAAVLLAAVGLGVWNLQLRGDLDERDDRLAALSRGGVIAPFAAASPEQAAVRGYLVRPAQGAPVAVLQGLGPAPEGRVYQFWAIKGGTARPLETLTPTAGRASVVPLSDLGDAELVGITIEQGPQQQPSSAPVLTATLAG